MVRSKCLSCGTQNPDSAENCSNCGARLIHRVTSADHTTISVDIEEQRKAPGIRKEIGPEQVAENLKRRYTALSKDATDKILNEILVLYSKTKDPGFKLRDILKEAARIMDRSLGMQEIGIGLKSHIDNLFRYEHVTGTRKEVELELKKLAYTYEDFVDQDKFKSRKLSRFTNLFLQEDKPFLNGEEGSFNLPLRLERKRQFLEEKLEADYMNIEITGNEGELVGWIEISSTKQGEFPDMRTLKWIELIAMIISVSISRDELRRKRPGK